MPILASELLPSLVPLFSSFLTQTTSSSSSSQASMPSSPPSSQHLSNESFSFGWLAGDEPHFELGPGPDTVVSRHRSSTSDAYDFDFGLVSRPLSPVLAHADQIFSNGFLLPLHVVVDQSKRESTSTESSSAAGSSSLSSSSTLSRSLSLDSSESYLSFSNRYNQLQQYSCNAMEGFPKSSSGRGPATAAKNKLPFLAKKYLCSLLPAWSKKACRRRSWWRLLGSKTTTTTERSTPPPTSVHHSCRGAGNRIVDNSYENAINDAILHCKKSVVSST